MNRNNFAEIKSRVFEVLRKKPINIYNNAHEMNRRSQRSWRDKKIYLVSSAFIFLALILCNRVFELTSQDRFCVSCHEMAVMAQEIKNTAHGTNRSGIAVRCADCHYPSGGAARDILRKMGKKIASSQNLLAHLLGTLNTPEKLARNRLELAHYVWRDMRKQKSENCRTCHSAIDYGGTIKGHKKADFDCMICHMRGKPLAHERPWAEGGDLIPFKTIIPAARAP